MGILKRLRQEAAYDRARLAIIAEWRAAKRCDRADSWDEGYQFGLDRAVRLIAKELAK